MGFYRIAIFKNYTQYTEMWNYLFRENCILNKNERERERVVAPI